MASIQEYFDAAQDPWDRPRTLSATTPRHPPNASRTQRYASNPSPHRRGVPRSSREQPASSTPAPQAASRPSTSSQNTRGPGRSSRDGQNATPRSSQDVPRRSRDPYLLARTDREREDPPPPPYEPLPPRASFAGSRASLSADRATLEGMVPGLEVVDQPPPISTLQDIRNDDAVIAVMGMTGSGKSTFISHFCSTARGNHGLRSATARVEAHVGSHPNFPGRRIVFVDTPGFDDTTRTDTEVLREIVTWLNATYAQNIKLCGIVYLHGVNVPRVGGSALTNMRFFRELCGDESMASVALATSHWSQSPRERDAQELRHDQLVNDDAFWRRMERNGARVFKHDRGERSARDIIQYLLNRTGDGVNLRVQREMAEGRTLDQTAVGMALVRRMEEMQANYERQLGDLRRELEEARQQASQAREQASQARQQASEHEERIKEIENDRQRAEARLKKERESRLQLKKDMKQLQREWERDRKGKQQDRDRSEERRGDRKRNGPAAASRRHGPSQNSRDACVIM